jgi:hypothetical protein
MSIQRHRQRQVYLLDAKDPEQALQRVEPRRSDVEYFVEHHDGFLYILTNSGLGCNYRLVQCPVDSTSSKHWQVLSSYQLVSAVSLLYSILWLTSDFFFRCDCIALWQTSSRVFFMHNLTGCCRVLLTG